MAPLGWQFSPHHEAGIVVSDRPSDIYGTGRNLDLPSEKTDIHTKRSIDTQKHAYIHLHLLAAPRGQDRAQ